MRKTLLLSWWWCVLGALPGWSQGSSEEHLRTAVVNIQELFRNYYKSQQTQEEINHERARIQKDHNDIMSRLRSMDEGLRQLDSRLQQPGMPKAERDELLREKGLRLQERESLDKQCRDTLQARHTELNQKMVVRMESLLDEIREIVADHAARAGFDLVFDIDGLNTSQVPFLLHSKGAVDITPILLKELNKDAPPRQ